MDMNTQYLTFSVSISIISWMVGMVFNSFFKKTKYYESCANINLIKSKSLRNNIKLNWFKWIVKNTFFKYFNPSLKISSKPSIDELKLLRDDMTFAELNHLVGFGFVCSFACIKFVNGLYLFGVVMIIVNVLLNLYPSLLQQENKQRIDKLLKRYA